MNDGCTHFDTGVGWKLQGRVDINIFITVNILQEKQEGRRRHVSPFISFCIDSPVCGTQTKDNNLKTTDIFHLCKKSHLKQTVTVISNKSLKQKHKVHLLKDIWFPSEYLEQQGCEGPNQEAIITVSDKHLKLMSLSQLGNISFLPPHTAATLMLLLW